MLVDIRKRQQQKENKKNAMDYIVKMHTNEFMDNAFADIEKNLLLFFGATKIDRSLWATKMSGRDLSMRLRAKLQSNKIAHIGASANDEQQHVLCLLGRPENLPHHRHKTIIDYETLLDILKFQNMRVFEEKKEDLFGGALNDFDEGLI